MAGAITQQGFSAAAARLNADALTLAGVPASLVEMAYATSILDGNSNALNKLRSDFSTLGLPVDMFR